MQIAVVGGGVTGLAAALRLLRHAPGAEVTLFEKGERSSPGRPAAWGFATSWVLPVVSSRGKRSTRGRSSGMAVRSTRCRRGSRV